MQSVTELCDIIEVPFEENRPSNTRREQGFVDALGTNPDNNDQFQDALEGEFSSEEDEEQEEEQGEDDEISLDTQSIDTGEYIPLLEGDDDFQSPHTDNQLRQLQADEEDIGMDADTFGEEGDDDLDTN